MNTSRKYTLEQLQNRILHFIDYRMRSKQEILVKLKQLAATKDQIRILIDRLAHYGLINDEKIIYSFIYENLYVKKRSISYTKQVLKQKGFSEPVVSNALLQFLESNNFSELEQAFHVLKQKYTIDKVLERKKILAYLGRKGFSYSVSDEAIKLYLKDVYK